MASVELLPVASPREASSLSTSALALLCGTAYTLLSILTSGPVYKYKYTQRCNINMISSGDNSSAQQYL